MNFVWFLVEVAVFNLFFWRVLSIVIFLPSVPVVGLIGYLTENPEKKWAKIALVPTMIIGFIIVGTLLPCAVFGMGMGLIALQFAGKATYPIIYFLLAGIGAFVISAPRSVPGMLISLGTYLTTVLIQRFTIFSGITMTTLFYVALWGLGILVLIGIISGIVNYLAKKDSVK